jgi:hypothetical protein
VQCQPGNFHASKKTICSSLQNGTDIKNVLHSEELVTEELPTKWWQLQISAILCGKANEKAMTLYS